MMSASALCVGTTAGSTGVQQHRSARPCLYGPQLPPRKPCSHLQRTAQLIGVRGTYNILRHAQVRATSPVRTGNEAQTSTTASTNGTGSSGSPATAANAASSSPGPSGATTPAAAASQDAAFTLKPIYVLIFALLFLGGLIFASMSLQLTSDMGFRDALTKVVRRIFRSIAFRQLVVITACMFLVRFALNNVLRFLAKWSSSPVQWDKSKMYYVMKEVYSPLELLLFIAGCCTIADSFVPQLINVPKATVTHVVRAVLSMSFVLGAALVVYNLKSRFCKEQAWQYEMQGNVTSQRRWEAYDKLGTFAIYAVGTVLVIQALGLEVRSVLAIGGIGGLAIGLAGREICENLLNGFLLMTTMPFEVGEEILFRPNGQTVEGIVVDVGWYRTLIRSFEREMYVIPNAVFSKNTVLNVTRKNKEWRFYEMLCVRVQDVHKVNAIIQDIRRIVRNDSRIINKLHRRVFLDKISLDDVKIYISFYCEASNRDAFMAIKQDLLLAFVDCVERNGSKLAQPRTVLEMDQETMLQTRLGLGLLPAPAGSPIGFTGSRNNGSNVPITVQVVDSVDVTATAVPVGGNGSSSNGSSGGTKSSSTKSNSSSGGAKSGAAAVDQQQQPAAAAAAAGGGVTFAAAAGTAGGAGAAVAAGMAVDGSSAASQQRRGDGSSTPTAAAAAPAASGSAPQDTSKQKGSSSPSAKSGSNSGSTVRSSRGGSNGGAAANPYTVVTYPSSAWPRQDNNANTMTVLASFEEI